MNSLTGVYDTEELQFPQLFQLLHKHIKGGTVPKKFSSGEKNSANQQPKGFKVKIVTRQV